MGAQISNKAALRLALEGHAKGDIGPMRAILDSGFVSKIHGPDDLFRWGGRREGYADALATISEIAADFTIHRHTIEELVEEGDVIWVKGVLDVTSHKTSRHAAIPIAGRWQFRGGKALAAEWYFDSARVASELGLAAR